jgi:MYXO-CTERM domain-containing protein
MLDRIRSMRKTLMSMLCLLLFATLSCPNPSVSAAVIFSNLGDPIHYEGGAWYSDRGTMVYHESMNYLVTRQEIAVQILVSSTGPVALDSIGVYVKGGSNAPYINYFNGDFDVNVYADSSNSPGALLERIAMRNVNTNPGNTVLYPAAPQIMAQATGSTVLSPGTLYWVGLDGVSTSAYVWYASRRQGGHLGVAGRSGPGGGSTFDPWSTSFNTTFAPNILVLGQTPNSAVPEPASSAIALLGLVALAGRRRLFKRPKSSCT